jgi:hypothetical protein
MEQLSERMLRSRVKRVLYALGEQLVVDDWFVSGLELPLDYKRFREQVLIDLLMEQVTGVSPRSTGAAGEPGDGQSAGGHTYSAGWDYSLETVVLETLCRTTVSERKSREEHAEGEFLRQAKQRLRVASRLSEDARMRGITSAQLLLLARLVAESPFLLKSCWSEEELVYDVSRVVGRDIPDLSSIVRARFDPGSGQYPVPEHTEPYEDLAGPHFLLRVQGHQCFVVLRTLDSRRAPGAITYWLWGRFWSEQEALDRFSRLMAYWYGQRAAQDLVYPHDQGVVW